MIPILVVEEHNAFYLLNLCAAFGQIGDIYFSLITFSTIKLHTLGRYILFPPQPLP
jgi:hypothetical protein